MLMVGSEFDMNNMKSWIQPACINSSVWAGGVMVRGYVVGTLWTP